VSIRYGLCRATCDCPKGGSSTPEVPRNFIPARVRNDNKLHVCLKSAKLARVPALTRATTLYGIET
jgi:hypothetical protein